MRNSPATFVVDTFTYAFQELTLCSIWMPICVTWMSSYAWMLIWRMCYLSICNVFIKFMYSLVLRIFVCPFWVQLSLFSCISILSLILDTHLAGHLVFPLLRGVTHRTLTSLTLFFLNCLVSWSIITGSSNNCLPS